MFAVMAVFIGAVIRDRSMETFRSNGTGYRRDRTLSCSKVIYTRWGYFTSGKLNIYITESDSRPLISGFTKESGVSRACARAAGDGVKLKRNIESIAAK